MFSCLHTFKPKDKVVSLGSSGVPFNQIFLQDCWILTVTHFSHLGGIQDDRLGSSAGF